MSEWWTYRLGSFLMFSADTYGRLVERHNAAVWPLQLLVAAAALGLLALAWRQRAPWVGHASAALLAVAWAAVSWGFLWQRFTPINWAAGYLAWAGGVQALACGWWYFAPAGRLRAAAFAEGGPRTEAAVGTHDARWARVAAAVLVIAGVLLWPLASMLTATAGAPPGTGLAWARAAGFGVLPEPTALATLGFLLLQPRPRWTLAVLPLLFCVLGAALAAALQQPLPWWPPVLAVLAMAVAVAARQRRARIR